LDPELRCNIEAYVDDVVIRIRDTESFLFDLAETFCKLRKFSMKLNPEKCMFGVPLGNYSDTWSPNVRSTQIQKKWWPS